MAKKAELEEHFRAYSGLLLQANAFAQQSNHVHVIQAAIASLPHITGMLRYEKRYQSRQLARVEILDLGISSAVAMLDGDFFATADVFLSEEKHLPKLLTETPNDAFVLGKQQHAFACQVWHHLDTSSRCPLDSLYELSRDQSQLIDWLLFTWQQSGFVTLVDECGTTMVHSQFHPDEKVKGKCPKCGAHGNGKRHLFWAEILCPKCSNTVCFVVC